MLKTIDIGHRNYSLDEALSVLETEVSRAKFEGRIVALKIIHGYGSRGNGGSLRRALRTWCREQSGRFRAVIPGEEYDLFHMESMKMRAACGQPRDPDLGRRNRGVTYLWL